ncbi:hypothetical protein DFJ67_4140 [Asanoa ferruginea]|uniref:Uncharacterized protein n=1 Tax=Asanoa ferruginea TaxID=53367 RepID=A0A3D9ZWQ0_9ACTN|nr:hypothetical protein DFJ67_4140 [Asanoa ferruginea]
MRDRSASRSYSPAGEEFRREHERHRAWGLTRRHAERLRRLRGDGCAPHTLTTAGMHPERPGPNPASPSVSAGSTPPDRAVRPAARQDPGAKSPTDQLGQRGEGPIRPAASIPAERTPSPRAEKAPSHPARIAPRLPALSAPDAPIGKGAKPPSGAASQISDNASRGRVGKAHRLKPEAHLCAQGATIPTARKNASTTPTPQEVPCRDPAGTAPLRRDGKCATAAGWQTSQRDRAGLHPAANRGTAPCRTYQPLRAAAGRHGAQRGPVRATVGLVAAAASPRATARASPWEIHLASPSENRTVAAHRGTALSPADGECVTAAWPRAHLHGRPTTTRSPRSNRERHLRGPPDNDTLLPAWRRAVQSARQRCGLTAVRRRAHLDGPPKNNRHSAARQRTHLQSPPDNDMHPPGPAGNAPSRPHNNKHPPGRRGTHPHGPHNNKHPPGPQQNAASRPAQQQRPTRTGSKTQPHGPHNNPHPPGPAANRPSRPANNKHPPTRSGGNAPSRLAG